MFLPGGGPGGPGGPEKQISRGHEPSFSTRIISRDKEKLKHLPNKAIGNQL